MIGGNTCWKVPGNAIGPVKIQQGSGQSDGDYRHTGIHVDGFHGFKNPDSVGHNNPLPEGVYWADVDGDGGESVQHPYIFLFTDSLLVDDYV